jgi:hypothetical protein
MSHTQAILFDRNYWTDSKAKTWLRNHNYSPIKPVHTTNNYLRYRLTEPSNHIRYRTIVLGNRIKAVVGYGITNRRVRNARDNCGAGINNQKILAIRPNHYARLLRPKRGGSIYSFITANPNLINNVVGAVRALTSLAAVGGIGYAISRKVRGNR